MNFLKAWRKDRNLKLFKSLLTDPSSGVDELVHNEAMKRAMRLLMNWLDRKHIIHCAECPATESMKKEGDLYFCPGHFAMLESKTQVA